MILRPLLSACLALTTLAASAVTVIFKGNGGLVNGKEEWTHQNAYVQVGALLEIGDPKSNVTPPAGYEFEAWHFGIAEGQVASVLTYYADPAVYVATYTKLPTYTIAFNSNGGSGSMAGIAMVCGTATNLTANAFTRTGYTFDGWATNKTGNVVYGDKARVIDLTRKDGATVTLYAHWTANTFTATFDPNNGSAPSPASKTVTYGQTYGALPDSSRTGYTFDGWYTAISGGTKVLDTTGVSITKDQTLYAHWTANTYTVTVAGDYGGSCPSYTFSGSQQTKTVTLPTRTGYTISGWSVEGASGGTPKVSGTTLTIPGNVHGNLKLTPSWSAVQYTVTVAPNGGTGGKCDPYTISASQQTKNFQPPTRTGYTILKWTVTGATSGSPTASGTTLTIPANAYGNLTLTPTWSPITYMIRHNRNDGTSERRDKEFVYDVGGRLLWSGADLNWTRTGYAFKGWAETSSGGVVYANGQMVTNLASSAGAVVNIYAVWDPIKYTVKFNANGGKGSMANMSLAYDRSTNLTANAFTRTGYTFDGWATNVTGEVVYGDKWSVRNLTSASGATVTLYAHWTANTCTVTFDGNGASGGWMSAQVLTYDVPANLSSNAFIWTGHTFRGWKGSDGKSYADRALVSNLTAAASASFTMTAQWTANSYTVTLDSDGGEGGAGTVSAVYDADLPGIAVPTRRGYAFLGYFETKDGSVMYYDADGKGVRKWNKAGNTTLYAHWKANTYTVCYDAFGGRGSMPRQTFAYDEVKTLLPNAYTYEGATFAGWKSSGVVYADGQVVSNLTDRSDVFVVFYARWKLDDDKPVVATNELSVAVGLTNLVLTATNDEWFAARDVPDAGTCAQSAGRARTKEYNNETMSLTVPCAGTLSFRWMTYGTRGSGSGVSGSAWTGDLALVVDGVSTNAVIAREKRSVDAFQLGWYTNTVTFTEGPHLVSWIYMPRAVPGFSDFARVDDVVWTPATGPGPAEILEVRDQNDVIRFFGFKVIVR